MPRTNISDKEQDQLEEATFESGIAVQTNGTQRVITKGRQGGAERRVNNGVIYPHDDKFSSFESDKIGRA